MAPLATAQQLASWLQVDSVESDAATLALNVASGAVRRYCGWSISAETKTGELVDGTGRRSVWLPTLRLTAVSDVTEGGVALVDGTDYVWTREGRLYRAGLWRNVPRNIQVTYTHGFDTVPDDVQGVTLSAAGRIYVNPEGWRQHTVGSETVIAVGASSDVTAILTEGERLELAGWRVPILA